MRELVERLAIMALITAIAGVIIYIVATYVFGPANDEAESKVPPSPLQSTTYDMRGKRVIEYYDTTTAHKWWVVREGNEWLVLDTAGTVSVG